VKRLLAPFLSPEVASRVAFITFLLVSPEYYWCRTHHFCCGGGHLEGADSVALPYLVDSFWCIGFLAAVVLAFSSRITFRYVFLFFLALGFLTVAAEPLFVLPIWMGTGLFSAACLVGWIE